jgi:hypothetical protein
MKPITIEGKQYHVIEDVSSPGLLAKIVATPEGEQVAVKTFKRWRFWTVADRLGRT